MADAETKRDGGEMPIIYMNGSVIPLTGHELVATLRNRNAILMLVLTVTLLSIPSGGGFFGEGPLWVRVGVNLVAVGVFLLLFPALLFEALYRAPRRSRLHLLSVSLPAALLATLSAEAFGIILQDSNTSRWGLLVKLGLGTVFWEAVVFLGIWFYGPVLSAPRAPAEVPSAPVLLSIGQEKCDPRSLLRIETAGRHLHLHFTDRTATVTARLRDVLPLLGPFGMPVHRCHWVAFDQLGPLQVKGRSYEMTTRRGDKVPVARDSRDAVRAALAGMNRP